MDRGPLRVPQASDRRVVNRSEAAQPRADESQGAIVEPKPVQRSSDAGSYAHSKDRAPRKKRRALLPIVVTIAVLVVVAAGWFAWSNMKGAVTGIDSSKYQAVFFTNGQVYFGKLSAFNDDYMRLVDVYYLREPAGEESDSENPQSNTTNQNSSTLIKLGAGNEIHDPEDEMIISKDQVLFYENLKPDGKLSQSIQQYKDAN